MFLDTLLLALVHVVPSVCLSSLVFVNVLLLKVGEPQPVVLHECFKDFANALDFRAHTLTHPDSTLHVFLLVLGLAARSYLLKALQAILELDVFGFDLLALLL